MKGEKTYKEIVRQIEHFEKDAALYYEKNNQAAGTRARKALDNIAKLKVIWRKECLAK